MRENGSICRVVCAFYTSKLGIFPLKRRGFGVHEGPFWESERTNGELRVP